MPNLESGHRAIRRVAIRQSGVCYGRNLPRADWNASCRSTARCLDRYQYPRVDRGSEGYPPMDSASQGHLSADPRANASFHVSGLRPDAKRHSRPPGIYGRQGPVARLVCRWRQNRIPVSDDVAAYGSCRWHRVTEIPLRPQGKKAEPGNWSHDGKWLVYLQSGRKAAVKSVCRRPAVPHRPNRRFFWTRTPTSAIPNSHLMWKMDLLCLLRKAAAGKYTSSRSPDSGERLKVSASGRRKPGLGPEWP